MTLEPTMTGARRTGLSVAAATVAGLVIAIPLTSGSAGPAYATATPR